MQTCLPESDNRFNSIKVRLEHFLLFIFKRMPLFQFHKGTIRTTFAGASVTDIMLFQFHKGTIRTHYNLEVGNLRINE